MGLFDKLLKKKESFTSQNNINSTPQNNTSSFPNNPVSRGNVIANKVVLSKDALSAISHRFISFDVETTGLSPTNDRIIEVGAVLFENGEASKQYGSLINIHASIPASATAVNHITNDMIISAPDEKTVFSALVSFFGDAINEKTIICAHNATFDMSFLCESLMRMGYTGSIQFVDTLSLSRELLSGLPNYKQDTVASHYNIINSQSHRAVSDAEVCGRILNELIKLKKSEVQKRISAFEASQPNEEEKEICAAIQKIIIDKGGSIDYLGYYKNSSNYVDVIYLCKILRFRITKKGKYMLVDKAFASKLQMYTEQCTMSEGGTDFVRVFFDNITDLEMLSDYIYKSYCKHRKEAVDYLKNNKRRNEYFESPTMLNSISTEEMFKLLESAENRKNNNPGTILDCSSEKTIIKRSDIVINPVNNRVSLDEIKSINDFDKGFDEGYKYWEEGDTLRKEGDLEKAIELFDLARYYGYNAPVLYDSYAMTYHKLKDYDNEIAILDEGIMRMKAQSGNTSQLEARQIKAIQSLAKLQVELKQKEEKQAAKEKKKLIQEEKAKTSSNVGRPVLKMTDEHEIIQRYDTIADAVRDTGISSKSIRDAAKGVQKHAGGFVWKYADEYNSSNDK